MIDLSIDVEDFQARLQAISRIPRAIKLSRRHALTSVGYHLIDSMSEWVRSEGEGTWPELSKVARIYHKQAGVRYGWRRRHTQAKPYKAFTNLIRFRVYRGKVLVTGFGTGVGIHSRFDKRFKRIAKIAEFGKRIRVTPSMRGFWGLQKKRGLFGFRRTAFPLRKETRTIEIPKRPIVAPTWQRERPKLFRVFELKFAKELKKEEKRL